MNKFIRNQIALLSVSAIIGVFFLASSWKHIQLEPIKAIMTQMLQTFSMKESKIAVYAHAITPDESKLYFGHDLISRGVQPVHLTIQNNTADEYAICPSSVDLPRVEPSKIASKVMRSTIPRAIAYKVVSFFFWPFGIAGAIDSIRVFTHQKNLKREIKAKSMRQEIVAPYSTFHRILFVPKKDFEATFKVTLIELESLKQQEMWTTLESPNLPAVG